MEQRRLAVQAIVRLSMGILFFRAFFFGMAGNWHWLEAWIIIIIQIAMSSWR